MTVRNSGMAGPLAATLVDRSGCLGGPGMPVRLVRRWSAAATHDRMANTWRLTCAWSLGGAPASAAAATAVAFAGLAAQRHARGQAGSPRQGTAVSRRSGAVDRRLCEYKPSALADYFASRPLMVVGRLLGVSWSLVSFGASTAWAGWLHAGIDEAERDRLLALRIKELFTSLGPTFVKLGQALSVRPDVLPDSMLQEFQEFQDGVKPFDHEEAMRLVKDELGLTSLREVFVDFGDAPVAAASLGQVYRARLRNGAQVAVKVQRPRLEDIIGLDLLLARKVAELLTLRQDLLPQGLRSNDFVGFVDSFASRTLDELDYVKEAKNAQRFAELYCDQPRLKVPVVYLELTRRRVLVMEWIDGVKLTNDKAIRALGFDPLEFISVGIECSMRQLLEHGYFHADPHPGNFFATPGGELCVLDFGMMSEMPKEARLSIIQHIVHLVNRDYLSMAQDYYQLGFLSKDIDVRPIAPKLEAFFDTRLQEATVSAISFKTIVDGLSEVVFKQYPFTIPSFYALVVRSLVNLEGLALSIDRDYRVLSVAYPYVARRILLDAELRQSLVDLLFDGLGPGSGPVPTADRGSAGRFRWDRAANLLRESSKSAAAVPSATSAPTGAGSRASDGELLLDLASALLADPAFRKTLLVELASTAEVLLTSLMGDAIARLTQAEGGVVAAGGSERERLGLVRLREEEELRLSEVRQTLDLIAEHVREGLPKGFDALAEAVGHAAQQLTRPGGAAALSGGVSAMLSSLSAELAGDFLGRLSERLAVRTLRTAASLIGDGESSAAPSSVAASERAGGLYFRTQSGVGMKERERTRRLGKSVAIAKAPASV